MTSGIFIWLARIVLHNPGVHVTMVIPPLLPQNHICSHSALKGLLKTLSTLHIS